MMDSQKDSFLKLINFKLKEKGLDNDPLYADRLKGELLDIEIAGEYAYFMDLYNKGTKYPINENNLLVVYLLDIAPNVDIQQEKAFSYGEMPDLDIDFIRVVRDYLKYDWAIKEFGKDYVCSIGSYTTFGIRSSLLDMARIFDYPLDEIRNVTTSLEAKDDEGKGLTWESALRLYPELKAWCDKYPDAAEAANKISKRIRGVSRHAAGIIISKVPLNDIVPIIKTKEGEIISAWAEGLSTQDLQPIGLIKSDWLVIKNLDQIELACKFIRDRHPVESINAFPGDRDWSDDSYLDDPKPLATASKGDLKCIFQFDNPGLQSLVKEGGITEFTDIGIYSSLWRPGCMQSGMHKTYVKRKKGVEKFSTHPLLEPILGQTFGVLVFQEQINKILNLIGRIPLKDCEIIRKAISKKRLDYFQKYKEMFVTNAQDVLKISSTEAEEMWANIEYFSEYGFNKCVHMNTKIQTTNLLADGSYELKEIKDFKTGDKVWKINENGEKSEETVVALHDHGMLEGYEVTFDDGYSVICSINHKFLTEHGQKSLKEIIGNNYNILCDMDKDYNAKKENVGMACSMRRDISKSTSEGFSLHSMSRMPEFKIPNGKLEIPLRKGIQNKKVDEKTSARLFGLQRISMEDRQEQWESKNFKTHNPLWFRNEDSSGNRRTSQNLSRMRKNKTGKYQSQEFENQSIRGSSQKSFRNRKKNFCSSRNTVGKSRKIEKMERRKSRKICKLYKSSTSYHQKIKFKNGNLADRNVELGTKRNCLRNRFSYSRFSERQYLDRSGRLLPFLRSKTQKKEFKEFIDIGSKKRFDVESRSVKKEGHNASSIQHGMLCNFNRSDETRMDRMDASHAPITNTRGLVSRKIVRVVSVGRQHMYDLEVASATHNFLLPNGIVTSNSHACGYAIVSSRLLWLKTYYPLEFYNAILYFEEEAEKIKEYKIDIKNHGIKLNPLDINLSKANFSIHNEELYYGFNKVKGIGHDTALKIEQGQPYAGFEDFIDKYGTDISTLKPLICLGCFKEAEPMKIYKYLEFYRDVKKKVIDAQKNYETKMANLADLIHKLLPNESEEARAYSEANLEVWKNKYSKTEIQVGKFITDPDTNEEVEVFKKANLFKSLESLYKRYVKAQQVFEDSKKEMPKLADFDENSYKIEIKPEFETLLTNIVEAEKAFYGFVWYSGIEKSPDCNPHLSFSQFDEVDGIFPVEFEILDFQEKKGKKVTYYQALAEDVHGRVEQINFWKDDYDRFEPELKKGELIRARLKPPNGGFKTFQFESYRKFDFKNKVPERKEDDFRLVVLKKGTL